MTNKQLQVLQHSLGVDEYGQGSQFRNHFCAGGEDVEICQQLITMGYMRQHPTTALWPDFNCSVTREGKAAMRDESPKPPKLTRSQRNYRAFLDADSDLTFIEWLKMRQLAGQAERGQ